MNRNSSKRYGPLLEAMNGKRMKIKTRGQRRGQRPGVHIDRMKAMKRIRARNEALRRARASRKARLANNIRKKNYRMRGRAGSVSARDRGNNINKYHYTVNVNAGTNASADDIARVTLTKIQEFDRMNVRSSGAVRSTRKSRSRGRGRRRNG